MCSWEVPFHRHLGIYFNTHGHVHRRAVEEDLLIDTSRQQGHGTKNPPKLPYKEAPSSLPKKKEICLTCHLKRYISIVLSCKQQQQQQQQPKLKPKQKHGQLLFFLTKKNAKVKIVWLPNWQNNNNNNNNNNKNQAKQKHTKKKNWNTKKKMTTIYFNKTKKKLAANGQATLFQLFS